MQTRLLAIFANTAKFENRTLKVNKDKNEMYFL